MQALILFQLLVRTLMNTDSPLMVTNNHILLHSLRKMSFNKSLESSQLRSTNSNKNYLLTHMKYLNSRIIIKRKNQVMTIVSIKISFKNSKITLKSHLNSNNMIFLNTNSNHIPNNQEEIQETSLKLVKVALNPRNQLLPIAMLANQELRINFKGVPIRMKFQKPILLVTNQMQSSIDN